MYGDSLTFNCQWNQFTNDYIFSGHSKNGIKSYELLKKINNQKEQHDKAFIMIGINDILNNIDVNDIFNNYIQIIDKLKKKNLTPVIQTTLYITNNPYQIKKNKINIQVENLNNLLKNYCTLNSIIFIDLNTILSLNKEMNKEYSSDGIHLTQDGYKLWYNHIYKYFLLD